MNRRSFLAAAVACAAPGAGTPRIIDTHTHFYDPSRPAGVPWPPKSDSLLYRRVMPADFTRLTAPLGVTGTVVVEASAWLEDNQWILDLAKDYEVIRGFIGHIDPAQPAFRQNLARFSRNPLFRGIRLGGDALRLSSVDFIEAMKRLAGAALTLDVIGPAAMIDQFPPLADHFPSLRIVIDHLPFDAPLPQLARLSSYPHIYAKVSGNLRREGIDEVWNAFGPDRLLFASNWPVSDRMGTYAERLAIVRDYFAAKSAGTSEKFFSSNARSAYGV